MLALFRALAMSVAIVGATLGTHHSTSGGTEVCTRNGVVKGNTLVAAVTVSDLTSISNVSDGTTTLTVADAALDWTTGTQRLALFSFPNSPGGNITITATFAGAQTFRGVDIVELTPSVFDVGSANSGSSAAPSSGNLTPATDGCVVLGFALGATALTSAGGFTDLANDTTVNISDVEGLAQAARAAVAATWTMTSGIWGAIAASYKPLPAGNPPLMVKAAKYGFAAVAQVMQQPRVQTVSSVVTKSFRRALHPFGAGKGKRTRGN